MRKKISKLTLKLLARSRQSRLREPRLKTISLTFCEEQLLCQFPFTKKITKPSSKHETRGQFHQHFTCSFYECRSQKRKKPDCLTVFFALLGSSGVKAAHKMLVKWTPGGTLTLLSFMIVRG